MLTELGRRSRRLAALRDTIARLALSAGLRPGHATVSGAAIGVGLASPLIASEQFIAAAVLLLLAGGCDGIDGTMARLIHADGAQGRFHDIMADRVTDAAIWVGIIVWSASDGTDSVAIAAAAASTWTLLSQATLAAAVTTGPIRLGPFQRTERLLLLVVGLLAQGLGLSVAIPVTCAALTIGSVLALIYRWRQI